MRFVVCKSTSSILVKEQLYGISLVGLWTFLHKSFKGKSTYDFHELVTDQLSFRVVALFLFERELFLPSCIASNES